MSNLIVGCGYLGLRVAELWRRQGQAVLGTTRQPTCPVEFARLGIEPVVCDVVQPDMPLLPAVDTVLYAVGFDRRAGQTMRQVYVEGLANVLAHLPRPRRFIYISSSSVYGQRDGSWVDETSPTEPEEESGQIVLDAERILREHLHEALVLRFAGIYGPGRLLRQKTVEAGEPIVGDADKWLNLVHVEDGARAVLYMQAVAEPGSTFNVSDGQPVRRRDFYMELARVLGAPSPRFVAPPNDQPMPPHEKSNRRVANRRLMELGFDFVYPSYRHGLAKSNA